MYSFKFDHYGRLVAVFPKTDIGIIALGDTFVAHEASLPVGQRLREPNPAQIQDLLTEAKQAAGLAVTNENLRAVSAGDYNAAIAEAKDLMADALAEISHKHRKNPAKLQEWGVDTRVGSRKILIIKPNTDIAWGDFTHAYIAKEQSLPENERVSDPSLSRLIQLDQIIQSSRLLRSAGENERGINIKNRATASARLLELLQLAGAILCLTRFDGSVAEELTRWGFKVVGKSAAPAASAAEEAAEETPAA